MVPCQMCAKSAYLAATIILPLHLQEAYLNSFNNYLLMVDDIDVHFIHAKSDDPTAIPLLLIHGWPGSYFEYHKCIQKLCHPGAVYCWLEDATTDSSCLPADACMAIISDKDLDL